MKKRSLFSVLCLICTLFLIIPSYALDNNKSMNWYCKRNKEHKQPQLDTNMQFIEEYDGYYVDKNHSDDCEDKVVYLTFDAGYENGNISKILDAMKAENVKGAFFILENLIDRNPELVMRMSDEGHIVANHTSSHKNMTNIENIDDFKCELDKLNNSYKELTGNEMSHYFRPPEGRFSNRSMKFASALGYKTIFWSIAYADWDNNKQPTPEYAKAKIFDNMHNGAVILLHPTSAVNAEILPDVIKKLKADGYRFGVLDELCGEYNNT